MQCTPDFFIHDFSVFGDSFNLCLQNMTRVLKRCEETNLVLNGLICHFVVQEGIILEYKVFHHGIEMD